MSLYLIRVELLGRTTFRDYSRLHSFMTRHGFTHTIMTTGGKSFDLPAAEYTYHSVTDAADVLESAKGAACKTLMPSRILVAKCASVAWDNLEPTQAEQFV